MNFLSLQFFCTLSLLSYSCSYSSEKYNNKDLPHANDESLFQQYVLKFKKPYLQGSVEYQLRFQHFLNTLTRLEQRNSTFYGLNKFSDLSATEFKNTYLSPANAQNYFANKIHPNDFESLLTMDIPKKLDWRNKGVVTPVKNQETCGGCWAFTAVELIESAWAKAGNNLVSLSSQQVIDCNNNSFGCRGGTPCSALSWAKQSKAKIVESSVYPFHDAAGTCRNVSGHFGVEVSEYFCESCQGQCPSVEMNKMIPKLVQFGPLSANVDALSWQDYVGGIIQHHCSYDNPDHTVQLVGYDLTGKIPFWIVRNSWGSDFGEKGYLYIKIGDNLCGIANSYAGVTKVQD